MKIGELELGLIDYIDNEIAAKATGIQKFLIYSGSALCAGKLENIFHKYKDHPVITSLGLVDENEEINVEELYKACKQGIKKTGTFEYMGIRFDESDIDSIHNYLKRRM